MYLFHPVNHYKFRGLLKTRWSVRKHVRVIVSIYLISSLQQILTEFIYSCICIQMGQMGVGFVQEFVVTQLRNMTLAQVLYQALANTWTKGCWKQDKKSFFFFLLKPWSIIMWIARIDGWNLSWSDYDQLVWISGHVSMICSCVIVMAGWTPWL